MGDNEDGGEEEQIILEREVVKEYRDLYINHDWSMIVYRINCWKREGNDKGRRRVEDNDKYEGLTVIRVPFCGTPRYISDKALPSRYNGCYIPCNHDKVGTAHCEVNGPGYPDDFIWIKDLKSPYGTYVNGRILPGNEPCKLRDGDIVSLGDPHDYGGNDFWVQDKKKRGFVFKVKSLKRCDIPKRIHPPNNEFIAISLKDTYSKERSTSSSFVSTMSFQASFPQI